MEQNEMKTKHTYKIQYADTDASRHIRLCDIERYLLEAGGESADQMGIGTNYLVAQYDCAWVLTRMTLVMDYLPCYLENITIETWVEQNAHMLSIRNYRIYLVKDGTEQLIGSCNSVWTLLNLTTRAVDTHCFADPRWDGIIDGEKLDLPRAPRLARIAEPTHSMPHTIHYTDLDYNNHCNSCKYTQFMLNACDTLTAVYPIRLDLNYVHEVHKGEHIKVDVEETPEAVKYCILTEQGDISCTGMLSKIN